MQEAIDRPAGLAATEKECAEGRTAPRVSLDILENNIAAVTFLTGSAFAISAARGALKGSFSDANWKSLDTLTICLLVLQNGFSIIGKSAPASPDNFDPELGRKLAYEDAVRQVWPLMGYELRQRLFLEQYPANNGGGAD